MAQASDVAMQLMQLCIQSSVCQPVLLAQLAGQQVLQQDLQHTRSQLADLQRELSNTKAQLGALHEQPIMAVVRATAASLLNTEPQVGICSRCIQCMAEGTAALC